jgi:two-component system, cell cycle response regulator DivK
MLLRGKRIFIVEDNIQNRIVFQMALTRQGASVDFDRWGDEAVHRLNNTSHVHLIILDLMLPGGVSGFDICQQIRAIPDYATVPLVAVSATEPAIAIPKARQAGFNGFIGKPIDAALFPKQLVSILNGEQIWYAGERDLG